MQRLMQSIQQHSLLAYYGLACTITWLCWLPMLVFTVVQGQPLAAEPVFNSIAGNTPATAPPLVLLLFALAVYGPFLASLIVTARTQGRAGLHDLWQRLGRWRVGIRWYLALLLLPLLMSGVAAAIILLIAGPTSFVPRLIVPVGLLIPYLIYQIVTSGLEEPGWRGYALPQLQHTYNAERASWLLGLLWAVWHFPFVIALYAEQGVGPLLAALVGFTMSIIAATFIHTWLYNNTHSILIAVLYHGWANVVTTLAQGVIVHALFPLLLSLCAWGVVLILLRVSPVFTTLAQPRQATT